jgi:MoaA/NifB/PqqE/SkfB family radical SAM enzyme
MTPPIATGSIRASSDALCRFRPIAGGGFRVALEVTRRCGLHCPHCFVPPEPLDPDLQAVSPLFHALKQEGCRKLILTGGEPLLRRDLEEIVAAATAAGIGTDLNSTLIGLTEARACALVAAGLAEASVSFYGDREFHDAFVGGAGCYDATLCGSRMLRALGVEIDVHGALWSANLTHMEHLLDLATSLSAGSLTFFKVLRPAHVTEERWLDQYPSPRLPVLLPLLEKLRARGTLPVRTVGFFSSQGESCEQSCSIVGIDAGLRLSACLLSRSTSTEPMFLGDGGFRDAFLRLKSEVAEGHWRPLCGIDSPGCQQCIRASGSP